MIAEHKRIAHSVLIVIFFVLSAKAIAAFKEMAIAWKYGVGDVIDAYQIANTFMLWFPTMLASAITVVLVPMFVKLSNENEQREQFIGELKTNLVILGIIVSSILVLFVPVLIPLIAKNINAGTQDLIGTFCLGFFIPAVCTGLISVYSARLISQHKQWNSLLEGVPALAILSCVLLWPSKEMFVPLLVGTVIGYVIQTTLLSKISEPQIFNQFKFRFSFKSKYWRESKNFIGLMFLAQFFMSWITPIDMINAADVGNGAVAVFSYSERLISLFLGLGAVAISRAILPVFSEIVSQQDWNKLRVISIQWAVILFLFGCFTLIICWFLAPFLVKVVFQRGAFTAENTIVVTEVFKYGLLRLPFYFSGLVLFQLLACQGAYRAIVVINLVCALIKYPLNAYFCDILGIGGINIATSVMYAWTALSLFLFGFVFSNKNRSCVINES